MHLLTRSGGNVMVSLEDLMEFVDQYRRKHAERQEEGREQDPRIEEADQAGEEQGQVRFEVSEFRLTPEDEPVNRIAFQIEEDLSAVAGFAILRAYNEDGHPITAYSSYGTLYPEEAIGLLTATLDQLRHEFIDRSVEDEGGILGLLGQEDVEEE